MNIPFRVKKLTETAKAPHRNCESDLWDLYADDFCIKNLEDTKTKSFDNDVYRSVGRFGKEHLAYIRREKDKYCVLFPQGRILVKTGISLELPKLIADDSEDEEWAFDDGYMHHYKYAVADIRPCSNTLEQRGLFIENKIITGGEVCFVAINHGHEPITISKGDKICQMSLRPLYPSKMEIVEDIEDTGRGAYGSTDK